MNPVKNCILEKPQLGQVRPTYHKLPPASFVYGKTTPKDKEGAQQMMKNWKYHQGSSSPKKEDSYILSNSLSIVSGLHKGHEFKKLRKSLHGKLKLKSCGSTTNVKIPDIVHGMPMRPSTPMQAVINNFYGNFAQRNLEEKEEKKERKNPNFVVRSKVMGMSLSRPEFKLKKFANVQSKTKCWVEAK